MVEKVCFSDVASFELVLILISSQISEKSQQLTVRRGEKLLYAYHLATLLLAFSLVRFIDSLDKADNLYTYARINSFLFMSLAKVITKVDFVFQETFRPVYERWEKVFGRHRTKNLPIYAFYTEEAGMKSMKCGKARTAEFDLYDVWDEYRKSLRDWKTMVCPFGLCISVL